MPRLPIPDNLIKKHSSLNKHIIRTIVTTILTAKTTKLRTCYIVDFTLPHIGQIKSHGNKKRRNHRDALIKDRKKKRQRYITNLMKPEKLLF